ncbi:hypothetical protein [uncultured Gemella sp.]|uniref:hypothetical protein n=1 Tax=uncultured Gemella sp. TaxID=254352 RepID=UPI0028D3BEA0|nr:hypothetical protein [uncultured Gemella sp.]
MINEELQEKLEQLASAIDWIKTKLVDLQEEKGLAPVKTSYEVEVPEDIENYYYVDELGGIYLVKEILNFDEYEYELIYQRGLAFKTREEAERYDKERQLIQKIKDCAKKYNGGWTPNENNTANFYIIYRNSDKTLDVNWCSGIRNFSKLPYFKSKRLAQQFIEEFGDEIKEVLC